MKCPKRDWLLLIRGAETGHMLGDESVLSDLFQLIVSDSSGQLG